MFCNLPGAVGTLPEVVDSTVGADEGVPVVVPVVVTSEFEVVEVPASVLPVGPSMIEVVVVPEEVVVTTL